MVRTRIPAGEHVGDRSVQPQCDSLPGQRQSHAEGLVAHAEVAGGVHGGGEPGGGVGHRQGLVRPFGVVLRLPDVHCCLRLLDGGERLAHVEQLDLQGLVESLDLPRRVPGEVLTDNGRQFTGWFGKPRPAEVMFERICRENGITQRLTKPRSPTTTYSLIAFTNAVHSARAVARSTTVAITQ